MTDGVVSALEQAKAAAGDQSVAVASATIAAQCLDAGLLDQVDIDLIPVILGAGIPFFTGLADAPVAFENPTVVEGDGVTHLSYRVRWHADYPAPLVPGPAHVPLPGQYSVYILSMSCSRV